MQDRQVATLGSSLQRTLAAFETRMKCQRCDVRFGATPLSVTGRPWVGAKVRAWLKLPAVRHPVDYRYRFDEHAR
jgi:predicted component of type VI protein secretion system